MEAIMGVIETIKGFVGSVDMSQVIETVKEFLENVDMAQVEEFLSNAFAQLQGVLPF